MLVNHLCQQTRKRFCVKAAEVPIESPPLRHGNWLKNDCFPAPALPVRCARASGFPRLAIPRAVHHCLAEYLLGWQRHPDHSHGREDH